jgi:alpha-L-fucosidase
MNVTGSTAVLFSLWLGLAAGVGHAQTSAPNGAAADAAAALDRWRAMRFGLFIHWGPVSLTGQEISWSRAGERRGQKGGPGTETPVEAYDNLYKQFNPTQFNAQQWIQVARHAGMKYLVFTTKHHDGFCNFDSALTDYKITNPDSPYGKDIVKQLAEACHEAGLALGWYYSPPDWHHPDYRNGDQHVRYIEYLHGQIREILSHYGPVDVMWFDGLGGNSDDWDSPRLHQMIRGLQPGIVINNRGGLPADFDTPEQKIGGFNRNRPWETCMTICQQWAWKPDDPMKPLQQCLQTLLRVAGGDGNLLFNVGPMPDGRIEPRQVERLKEMGDWLKQFGEGVYGTRGGPFKPGRWGASTCLGNRIYLFVMNWPSEGPLELPVLPIPSGALRTLTRGQATMEQTPEGIRIALPQADRDEIATVLVLEVQGRAFDIPPLVMRGSESLASGKKATASNVYQNQPSHGSGQAFDDDPETRWATDAGTHNAWLEVDLGEPQSCARALISEAYAGRVKAFELQYRDDQGWKVACSGQALGENAELSFEPVKAQRFRLNITEASEGPTIFEFQLFPPKK